MKKIKTIIQSELKDTGVACTGTKDDDKIFVATFDDALDSYTKKRGTTSL